MVSTLVLANNSLLNGNVRPPDGFGPVAVAYDSSKAEVFVADGASDSLSVISTTSDKVVAIIPVAVDPDAVLYDGGRGEVIVGGNGVSGRLSIVNDTSNTVVASVSLSGGICGGTAGLAYDSGRGQIFATVCSDLLDGGEVAVVNDTSNSVVATVPVNGEPIGAAYDSAKGQVFVAATEDNQVKVISDTSDTVSATIPVGAYPTGVAYDAGKGEVFVTNCESNTTSVINDTTDSVIATVPVGGCPYGLAYDSARGEVVVANLLSDNVSVISDLSNSVVSTVSPGEFSAPAAVVYDGAAGELFVDDSGNNRVMAVSDTSDTLVATIGLSAQPWGLALDSGKGEVFVTDDESNAVYVVSESTDRVVAVVPVGSGPTSAAYDNRTGQVFVTNEASDNVSVIADSNNSVVATITLPTNSYPDAATYDSEAREVFVADSYAASAFGNVSVISDSSDTVVATIPVGSDPLGLAYDSGRNEVFVTNSGSSSVTVIEAVTDTVFLTISLGSGNLPAGAAYAAADGSVFVAVNHEVVTLGTPWVLVINDSSDSVVAGVGPPVIDGLWVNDVTYDSATAEVFATGTSQNSLVVINASSHTLQPGVPVGEVPIGVVSDPSLGRTYVANAESGTITIIATDYPLSFHATGLPAGSTWAVTVPSIAGNESNVTRGASGTIAFSVPTGQLAYSVTPPAGYGVARVTGPLSPTQTSLNITGATTIRVVFAPLENLTFSETGLPATTLWGVELRPAVASGGPPAQSATTHTSTLSFTVVRGSWKYRDHTQADYLPGLALARHHSGPAPFRHPTHPVHGVDRRGRLPGTRASCRHSLAGEHLRPAEPHPDLNSGLDPCTARERQLHLCRL